MKFKILAVALLAVTSAHAKRGIRCSGPVSFAHGTMAGIATVRIVEEENGNWYLDLGSLAIDGGRNLTESSQGLKLRNYPLLSRHGFKADYDVLRRSLTFRYKYDSGIVGGGVQWTGGTFQDCEEFETDHVKPPTRKCGIFAF